MSRGERTLQRESNALAVSDEWCSAQICAPEWELNQMGKSYHQHCIPFRKTIWSASASRARAPNHKNCYYFAHVEFIASSSTDVFRRNYVSIGFASIRQLFHFSRHHARIAFALWLLFLSSCVRILCIANLVMTRWCDRYSTTIFSCIEIMWRVEFGFCTFVFSSLTRLFVTPFLSLNPFVWCNYDVNKRKLLRRKCTRNRHGPLRVINFWVNFD